MEECKSVLASCSLSRAHEARICCRGHAMARTVSVSALVRAQESVYRRGGISTAKHPCLQTLSERSQCAHASRN